MRRSAGSFEEWLQAHKFQRPHASETMNIFMICSIWAGRMIEGAHSEPASRDPNEMTTRKMHDFYVWISPSWRADSGRLSKALPDIQFRCSGTKAQAQNKSSFAARSPNWTSPETAICKLVQSSQTSFRPARSTEKLSISPEKVSPILNWYCGLFESMLSMMTCLMLDPTAVILASDRQLELINAV
jgi:hypothetical protein